jgi:3'(2'), 5'-bisphosphate nucleotidase
VQSSFHDPHMSKPLTLPSSLTALRFCESVESGHSSHQLSQLIAKKLDITEAPVRMDSQCKYGIVARGDAQIYMRIARNKNYEENIWVKS